ncbi:glucose 1-dehydrogenase [Paenibacillus flagellatus]|uniref:3-ketoacyl-ACP reductase n=1 Tax=Paenibacillus flagellatus TaxID=2211139 RepID=A0A2V5KBE4_9BACL|nr:glucose 1-dehydrogenase [Paenibacillus flagellatus]PYI55424.1 3-ketoacyl-ACP reductase [Paenibacillus flagellatus]
MSPMKQVAVVTGAGSGIGKAVSADFAARGYGVVVAELDAEAGERQAAAIREAGGSAIFVRTDVRREPDVVRLMEAAVEAYGTIDVLINNAGVSRWKPVYELTADEWDDVLGTNLRGSFLCAREAAKVMRRGGGGAIIQIASTRAMMSEPHSEAYAASKGGIVALTHALAVSLGPDGIRVNCISPGWIETGDYEALRDVDHRQHPAGRVGTPEDVVRACRYFADPGNDFVTGTNLAIDGGMTRKMIYEP